MTDRDEHSEPGMTLKEVAAELGFSYEHVLRLVQQYERGDKRGLASTNVGTGRRKHRRVSRKQLERFKTLRLLKKNRGRPAELRSITSLNPGRRLDPES